ncbi:MAG: D-alanine--D-alanine ligase A [Chloroflexota bacterium]
MKRKIRVGVIFGGRSSEHEVSLMSARSVMAAMDKTKYEIIPIGITKTGRWLTSGDPMLQLTAGSAAAETPQLPQQAATLEAPGGAPKSEALVAIAGASSPARPSPISEIDVIFPVLHGPYGEDGTIQGLLELADIPYVGAGVLASAVGMDKVLFKDLMRAHNIPVADYRLVLRSRWERQPEAVIDELEAAFPYPMFVKPANLGSSVGVTKAHNRAELAAGLAEAAQYDRRLLVERGLNAREIEVSVLGNEDPIASVPGEIIPSREFYDYAAKYLDNASELLIPAPIPPETAERARELALRVYRAVDGAGMARVDFLLERTTGELYVGEINTIPGFTAISMYPKLWEASGIPYSELIDRLIQLALERHAQKQRSRTDDKAKADG